MEPLGFANEDEEEEKLDYVNVKSRGKTQIQILSLNYPIIRKTAPVDEYPPNQVGFYVSIRALRMRQTKTTKIRKQRI